MAEIDYRKLRWALSADLRAFAKGVMPSYELAPHLQKLMLALMKVESGEWTRLLVVLPPRHGKLCADSTPVLTPQGWVTHGDLRVGDYVFSPSGKPVRVVGVTLPGMASVDVEFVSGEVIKVHPNHEWKIHDRGRGDWKIVETKYLMGRSLWSGRPKKRAVLQVPLVAPLQYPEQELSISPYMLGVWLGDGTTSKPSITYQPSDSAVIMALGELGFSPTATHIHKDTGVYTSDFWGLFYNLLKEEGLLGFKHIPDKYLCSSVDQRSEILAGLIDSDGHVDPKGRVRIVCADERLVQDIYQLVLSLGLRPYIMEAEPTLSSSGIQGTKMVYTIGFQPTFELPTRLPRKAITRVITQRRLGIKAVRYSDPEPGHCIQVDSEDGLYLVGRGLIPTHNSLTTSEIFPAWFLGRNPNKMIMMTSYSGSLAGTFAAHVRQHMDHPAFQIAFGGRHGVKLDRRKPATISMPGFRGGLYAAGVLGGLTGRGADLLLIDDPVKDALEAQSSIYRQRTWDWYACFHPDTELLTGEGWKPVADVMTDEVVATVNPDTREIEYRSTTDTMSYPYDGELITLYQRDGAAFSVTPNHEIFWAWESEGKLRKSRVDELPDNFCIPRTGLWKNGTIPARITFSGGPPPTKSYDFDPFDWYEFLGLYVAEGNAYENGNIFITQIKEEGRQYVRTLLSRLGVTFWESPSRFSFRSKSIASYLLTLGRKAHLKKAPPEVLWACVEIGEVFLKGLFAGDGEKVSETRFRFTTSSKQLSDDVYRLAFQCGYKVAGSKQPDRTFTGISGKTYTAKPTWVHSIRKRGLDGWVNQNNTYTKVPGLQRERYCGPVHCVTVPPHHSVVIRYKGRVSVSGQSTAYSRLEPGGRVIIIQTRWNQDDLAGRILSSTDQPGSEEWKIIHLPAINKQGEALWPERYPVEVLRKIEKTVGRRVWQALYQGQPVPEEGALVNREWFPLMEAPPGGDSVRRVRYWDFAATESTDADFTVGLLMSKTPDGVFTIEHVIRFQLSPEKRNRIVRQVAERDLALYGQGVQVRFEQEPGASGIDMAKSIVNLLSGFDAKSDRVTGAKQVRFDPFRAQAETGAVRVVKGDWNKDYFDELMAFPYGVHDDQVDCTSGAFNALSLRLDNFHDYLKSRYGNSDPEVLKWTAKFEKIRRSVAKDHGTDGFGMVPERDLDNTLRTEVSRLMDVELDREGAGTSYYDIKVSRPGFYIFVKQTVKPSVLDFMMENYYGAEVVKETRNGTDTYIISDDCYVVYTLMDGKVLAEELTKKGFAKVVKVVSANQDLKTANE